MKKPYKELCGVALLLGLAVVIWLGLTGIWVDWSQSPCEGHRELRWAWDEAVKSNARVKVEENISKFLAVRAFNKIAETGSSPRSMDCAACNRELERKMLLESRGL